jgi:putative heme-binding domain-containing protein
MTFWLLLPLACSIGAQQSSRLDREKDLPEKNPYTSAEDARLGRQYFLGHCGQCHGPEGQGGRGVNLTTGRLRHGSSDRELYMTLRQGISGSEMPGSRLSQIELWRIVTYVRTLGAAGAEERATGDPVAGEAVYHAKGCDACHLVRGQGGLLGPDLSDIGFRRSLKFLRESVIQPDAHIAADYRSAVVAPRSGPKIVGIVLNEDDYSIQLRDRNGVLRAFVKADLKAVEHPSKSLMPAYGSALSDTQLEDLVAYLSSLRGTP